MNFQAVLVLCVCLANIGQSMSQTRKGRARIGRLMAKQVCQYMVSYATSKTIQTALQKPEPRTARDMLDVNPCYEVRWEKCESGSAPNCSLFEFSTCITNPGRPRPGETDTESEETSRISGGREVRLGEVPYIANIYNSTEDRTCSAVIINSQHLLTLGDCAKGIPSNGQGYKIHAGDFDIFNNDSTEQIKEIKRVVVHPNLTPTENNLALIEVTTPFLFSRRIQPALMPLSNYAAVGPALISGWGQTASNLRPNILSIAQVTIATNEDCKKKSLNKPIPDKAVCILPRGASHCDSDAGGPISVKILHDLCHILAGIIQSAFRCGQFGTPSLGVRVSSYLPWIRQETNPHLTNIMNFPIPPPSNAQPNEFPHIVRILDGTTTLCSGAILSAKYVVTVATCLIHKLNATSLSVIAGDHDTAQNEQTEQTKQITKIVVHPDFDTVTHGNDLALVQLTTDLQIGPAVGIVALGDPGTWENPVNVQMAGWQTLAMGQGSGTVLQKIPMMHLDYIECGWSNICSYVGLEDLAVCASAAPNSSTSCKGDLGSPITSVETPTLLYGVLAVRLGCNDSMYPSIFTHVPHYAQWLTTNMV